MNKSSYNIMEDGHFDITFLPNGVYLTVFPAAGKGKRVDAREVLERLGRKRVRNFSREIIDAAVFKADGLSVRIADYHEDIKLDATAAVTVSPDKMKAYITIYEPDGGKMLGTEDILKLLKEQGVAYGIDKAVLDSLSKYPQYRQMICIAEGTPPVNGRNGKVEFNFDTRKDRKPTVLEDGRVDFRELNIVQNVNKGQKLCSLIPPVEGTRGRTVTGTEIPALDGKPVTLPRGRNTEISEDAQSLIANINGQVEYIDGKINVFSTYEVPADVDNSTGNIYFVGNVCVRGNVLSGFVIEAGGNVEVWGVVEGAVIKAEGDIILRRGMQGLGKGVLISGGSIIARYIEHSNIEARNDIQAEAIMHSNVKCGNRLELSGRKGLLVGGSCKVGNEIAAKVIGSHMATVTDLEVGIDPTLRDRYKTLRDEITGMENDISKTDQAVALLRKFEAVGKLTPEKQEMLARSIKTSIYLNDRINELKEELLAMEEKLQQETNGRIRAYNFVYPGCRITIGTCKMFVKETLQYCTLYRDGADVRVGPIDR